MTPPAKKEQMPQAKYNIPPPPPPPPPATRPGHQDSPSANSSSIATKAQEIRPFAGHRVSVTVTPRRAPRSPLEPVGSAARARSTVTRRRTAP